MKKFLLVLSLALASTLRAANLECSGIFTDHMVLQREKPVAVWGWADANETVTVEFNGQKKTTKAGANGKWMLKLDAMKANADSQKLVVKGSTPSTDPAKPRQCVFEDVLVGEVWLGSGQSNMSLQVARCLNPEEEKAAANFPLIREFGEKSLAHTEPKDNCKGKWTVCSPETVSNYSAALYFMAREIHKELKVPVGIIQSSVGGTPIENWIDLKTQLSTPELKETTEAKLQSWRAFDEAKAKAKYIQEMADWNAAKEKAKSEGQPEPTTKAPVDQVGKRKNSGGPGELFNGKIAGLTPFTIRGIIWYQGEANAHSAERGKLYQTQLPTLVKDWRKLWNEELPFCWAQLPNFDRGDADWPWLREAQLKSLSVPNTGMITTMDIGEKDDIHPKNKQEIGRRFALWALNTVYGKKIEYSGPLPTGREIKGDKVTINFSHADGLKIKEGTELKGFEIANGQSKNKVLDENKKEIEVTTYNYAPAKAVIENGKVVVSSDTIKKPIAVRYAWANNPECSLVNQDNLPASPFRFEDK
jgi:sialate O-acetylesterase